MANEISLVTASGRTVTPKDDGIIYEVFSPGNGIIYGGAVTIKDSSTLHITAGHGIVCGRKFTIDDSDIPVALSGSGSLLGRLYIHLDLADAADPITLLVETGASLTPVVQDSDVNINNGVYEINIATFDVDTSTISNLVNLDVTVAPMGDMEGATSALDGKGGYVPAPQAGDEDKVLKGDGTWGTAGDTATVRYDENTQYVQLKDSQGWFDWRKAGRAFTELNTADMEVDDWNDYNNLGTALVKSSGTQFTITNGGPNVERGIITKNKYRFAPGTILHYTSTLGASNPWTSVYFSKYSDGSQLSAGQIAGSGQVAIPLAWCDADIYIVIRCGAAGTSWSTNVFSMYTS